MTEPIAWSKRVATARIRRMWGVILVVLILICLGQTAAELADLLGWWDRAAPLRVIGLICALVSWASLGACVGVVLVHRLHDR